MRFLGRCRLFNIDVHDLLGLISFWNLYTHDSVGAILLIHLDIHHFLWSVLSFNINFDDLLRRVRLLKIDIHLSLWQVLLLHVDIQDLLWRIRWIHFNIERSWRRFRMLDINIDHFLRRILSFHLQFDLVIMLYRLLLDLKVDAVSWFRWILLNIHDGFVLNLLWTSLDIEADLVLGLFEFIFFHVNMDYRIGLLSRLLLLDIKSSCGLGRWSIVDRDFSLGLLQRLWLNDVDDALRLSDWRWLFNLDVNLLLGW